MKNKIYILILFIAMMQLSFFAFCQDTKIVRYTLSVLGHKIGDGDKIKLDATLGQPSNTLTGKNENLILRQGFQQNYSLKNLELNQKDKNIEIIDFYIYPNPSSHKVNLFFNIKNINSFDVRIYSSNSILMETRKNLRNNSSHSFFIDYYPKGVYLFNIYADNGNLIGSKRFIVSN